MTVTPTISSPSEEEENDQEEENNSDEINETEPMFIVENNEETPIDVNSSPVEAEENSLDEINETDPTMNSNDENPMVRTVRKSLDAMGLTYDLVPFDADRPGIRVFVFRMGGRDSGCGMLKVIISVKDTEDTVQMYTVAPMNITSEHRVHASTYLTIVNYGLSFGNFEFDFRDGEVRYKNSCRIPGASLSPEMVQHMFGVSIAMMERYFPGLMAVVYGGKDPQEVNDDIVNKAKSAGENVCSIGQ